MAWRQQFTRVTMKARISTKLELYIRNLMPQIKGFQIP